MGRWLSARRPSRRSSSGKQSTKLQPSTRSLYPYDNLAEFEQKAKFFPMPPLEPDGTHASYTDWQAAYQRFKAA